MYPSTHGSRSQAQYYELGDWYAALCLTQDDDDDAEQLTICIRDIF